MERQPTKKRKAAPRLADLDTYRRQGGRMCGVCISPHRKFIEEAFAAGHSKPAIRQYLVDEFGEDLPFLGHHLLNHLSRPDSYGKQKAS